VIVAVTARLGPTSVAERQAVEERQEELLERDEEAARGTRGPARAA
jgi:hypothetical protein